MFPVPVASLSPPPTLDGMTEVYTPGAPTYRDEHDDAARVESQAPEGWRCVWLPRHGRFLAYLDVEMADADLPKPAVAEPDVDAVLGAIRALGELCDVVRAWVDQHQEGDS